MGGGGGGRGGGGAEPGQAGCGDKRHGVRRGAEETLVPLPAPSWSFRWLHPRWEREGGRRQRSWELSSLALPSLPHGPCPLCAGSRALASPLPPAAGRAPLPPPVRPAGVGGRGDLPPALCVVVGGCLGWESGFSNPSSLTPLWGAASGVPSVAGRGQAGLRDFLFLREPGRRNRCLSWGWCFFPSPSLLVAHKFLQLLPRLAREVLSR